MMEGFKTISLSYKSAPIEIREKVTFEGAETSEFLLKLKEVFDIEEALLISTCNRTEVYYSAKNTDLDQSIIQLMASFKGLSAATLQTYFRFLENDEAIAHLFRVALGLESKVLGDIQISNQVKKAYQSSADLHLAGPFLHRLMHTIFYANKRVVQETRLQDGTASVASVAVDLINRFVGKIEKPRIALIGLGEIGQNVLENLDNPDLKVTLINRTRSKADKIAKDYQVAVGDFSDLGKVIKENDVIISAISAKRPIISSVDIPKEAIHKLFVDLSVPRSINPEIDSTPGISVYNVDQLTERTLKAKQIREEAVPQAENIISEALEGFKGWKNEMEVSPTIQRLKKALEQIRLEELSRHSKLSDQERDLLEMVTKNMIQKVIKLPVLQLKAACKRGEAETLVGVLNDLFNLEQQEVDKK